VQHRVAYVIAICTGTVLTAVLINILKARNKPMRNRSEESE
jgi:fructose-specific phosphotransferase system IIC component